MKTLAATLLLALALPAAAFEVADFKSGQSREQVKELLKTWNFDRQSDESEQTLLAWDGLERGTGRRLTFSFCNDRLAEFQQEMKPSPKHFMVIAANFNAAYGQPFKVVPSNSVTSVGERAVMALFWRNRGDIVGVRYLILPGEEQLAVVHAVSNPCWQVPRQP